MNIAEIEAKYQVGDDDPIVWRALQRKRRAERKARKARNDASFAEGIEAFENGAELRSLPDKTQRDGWRWAEAKAENVGTFQLDDDPCEMHNILHSLRSGEIEFLCEFSEADYDAMESERIGEYEVRAL